MRCLISQSCCALSSQTVSGSVSCSQSPHHSVRSKSWGSSGLRTPERPSSRQLFTSPSAWLVPVGHKSVQRCAETSLLTEFKIQQLALSGCVPPTRAFPNISSNTHTHTHTTATHTTHVSLPPEQTANSSPSPREAPMFHPEEHTHFLGLP